jgi:4-hydroxy-tetrahydrodipicolinate synthase
VCIFGGTGANGVFTDEERRRTIPCAIEHVNGRVPVVAGIRSPTFTQTANLARAAEDLSADGGYSL